MAPAAGHTLLCCSFGNNRGVKVAVEQGGRSGTKFNLFQGSYSNLTTYLVHTMGYTLGKDLFAAPYDWRMHISGGWSDGCTGCMLASLQGGLCSQCESLGARSCMALTVLVTNRTGYLQHPLREPHCCFDTC
jgi:hypothetical protein